MKKPIIGLEIHVELKTDSKMFCSCRNDSDEKQANKNVCPICLAHPGALPRPNKKAVEFVVKTGKALGCTIDSILKFDRKNYFYPDIPKGYQITQDDHPICSHGSLLGVAIRRIHLEEDTGRLSHLGNKSIVDFNRAGVPLMELVTDPVIKSAEQAKAFAEELQLILRYLGVSDANMEKGEMRVEANVSLEGQPKVEVKNLNSFRSLERAINYEIERQSKEDVVLETRGWDENNQRTFSQRAKEEAADYRYCFEPDIPPIPLQVEVDIPELPQQRRERFQRDYDLKPIEIDFFVQNRLAGDFFEQVGGGANWIINNLKGKITVSVDNFKKFLKLNVPNHIAKILLAEMIKNDEDPEKILKENNWQAMDDIGPLVDEVVAENQTTVEEYRNGKEAALQFLIGKVMAKSKGQADPNKAREELLKLLS
jgi:aspartyl-tRNA(Asn)/glutamyl-tRNA(Gln) amidotransferase subunit B